MNQHVFSFPSVNFFAGSFFLLHNNASMDGKVNFWKIFADFYNVSEHFSPKKLLDLLVVLDDFFST
jgi:hypothetical protein